MHREPADRQPDESVVALHAKQGHHRVDGVREVLAVLGGIAVERRGTAVGAGIGQVSAGHGGDGGTDVVVRSDDRVDDSRDQSFERARVEARRGDVVEHVAAVPARPAVGVRGGEHDVAGGVPVAEDRGQPAEDLRRGGLEEHRDVGHHVHDLLGPVVEHERPRVLAGEDAAGPLVGHAVAHHPDAPGLAGDVGDGPANLQRHGGQYHVTRRPGCVRRSRSHGGAQGSAPPRSTPPIRSPPSAIASCPPDDVVAYFDGNSLGRPPRATAEAAGIVRHRGLGRAAHPGLGRGLGRAARHRGRRDRRRRARRCAGPDGRRRLDIRQPLQGAARGLRPAAGPRRDRRRHHQLPDRSLPRGGGGGAARHVGAVAGAGPHRPRHDGRPRRRCWGSARRSSC